MGPPKGSRVKGAIKTFIIDWPVLIFLGLVFGHLAPDVLWWRSRAFVLGLVTTAVFLATALISFGLVPDWMWMYYVDPNEIGWALMFMPAAYFLVFALSFVAAVGMRLSGWAGRTIPLAILMLLWEVLIIALTWDRYRFVGTAEEWSRGTAAPLFSTSPEGAVRVIGALGPVFLAVFVLSLIVVRRSGREIAADR